MVITVPEPVKPKGLDNGIEYGNGYNHDRDRFKRTAENDE